MNKSVIVHGPQACGKTRNADHIAAHFGLHRVIDGWNGGPLGTATGNLYLTNLGAEEIAQLHPTARRVVAYHDLPAHVRR